VLKGDVTLPINQPRTKVSPYLRARHTSHVLLHYLVKYLCQNTSNSPKQVFMINDKSPWYSMITHLICGEIFWLLNYYKLQSWVYAVKR